MNRTISFSLLWITLLSIGGLSLAQRAVETTSNPRPSLTLTIQDRIIKAAESFLGKPYVFGGRNGRWGCVQDGRRIRCESGIDCQSLIFFAYEKVFKTRWTSFSVKPSECVRKNQLGHTIDRLNGVLREKLNQTKLQKADVLFFLLRDYNLEADPALWIDGDQSYGVWHMGLVHEVRDGKALVIHAKPGDKVMIEPLDQMFFEAVFVVRYP